MFGEDGWLFEASSDQVGAYLNGERVYVNQSNGDLSAQEISIARNIVQKLTDVETILKNSFAKVTPQTTSQAYYLLS
jgi:hypothetical protein